MARDGLFFGASGELNDAKVPAWGLLFQGLWAAILVLLRTYDLLLTPTMAVPAFPVGQQPSTIAGRKADPFWGFLPFTYPINMAGHPAATVPCGCSSDGMPIGLHLIGRRGDEVTVLRASAAFERARPWADRRPPIAQDAAVPAGRGLPV